MSSNQDRAEDNSNHNNNNNTNDLVVNKFKSNFMEFKKEAQKIVQSRSALILVVDPGPPEEIARTSSDDANNNNSTSNDGTSSTTLSPTTSTSSGNNDNNSNNSSVAVSLLAQVAKKKQELRCAEVDRCCKAICKVLSGESVWCSNNENNNNNNNNNNDDEDGKNKSVWNEKVASLPLVLINTSSGVSKFRRATRLFNGRSAFLVISEDFFKGVFYTVALDKVKFIDEFPSSNTDDAAAVATSSTTTTTTISDSQLVVTPSPFSVLTICEKMLEKKIFNFFKNYQETPCPLRRTLLGAQRPDLDRDDHVGTHSCAFVQETYQEQLRNQECCTLVVYHASSCPACPCALRCADFIVSFLQLEAAKLCTEHQRENHLQDDAEFKSISQVAKINYPVKSGVVDFCPCGLKKTEKWPLLVCGAFNIEENEIDHTQFPALTVPHFRFFPCGKEKEKRRQIIERSERCPTFLFDRVREHYFSAAAQYSDGLATNEIFSKCVNIIFERAKVAVERKLAELCPQVAASLQNKIREDFVSAGVVPDEEDSQQQQQQQHSHGSSDDNHNNNNNVSVNSEDAAQNNNNNNNNNLMNCGNRVIRPEDIVQRTAEFDTGVRRSREPCC